MPFLRVDADDHQAVARMCALRNAADAVDDPDAHPYRPEVEARWLKYGWDLHPAEVYLFTPDDGGEPVGFVSAELPVHDNLHLIWCELIVHPEHRRRGHGRAMLAFARELAADRDRSTMWLGTLVTNPASKAFLEVAGFRRASSDARRRQRLADVDWAEIDRLEARAREASVGYDLQRLTSPIPAEVLVELVAVTEAINDAPMGSLTYENETFDLDRVTEVETAAEARGARAYRVVARNRDTGEVGGHTQVQVQPGDPEFGQIGDTAVSRTHRGHRLGLRLKIDMLRWLAEAEPALTEIETWNNVDNTFMINVNEALGYRLSGTFEMYEHTLG